MSYSLLEKRRPTHLKRLWLVIRQRSLLDRLDHLERSVSILLALGYRLDDELEAAARGWGHEVIRGKGC